METLALYGAALSDKHNVDIRMEAATAKMWNSERSWEVADMALQLRGGRGFETEKSVEGRGEVGFPMERVLRDTRINRIVEGTTDVMHLFIAREALDGHLRNAGGLFKKGATLWEKIKVVGKCALIYPKWYIGNLFGSIFDKFVNFDDPFVSHLDWIESRTRKLALTLFHQMLLRGPKLEMRQMILARLVDIGAELAVMALTISRLQTEERTGSGFRGSSNRAVVEHFLSSRRRVVERLFEDVWENSDELAVNSAKVIMETAEHLPRRGNVDLPASDRKFCSDYTR
jgi:hypothetical protein